MALAGLLLGSAGTARGNGAFPDSFRVFVPAERPDEIVLATNFGLISSIDGGHAWRWVCEHDDGLFGARYDMGPGALPRLYAAVPSGMAASDDEACSWT